MGEAKRRGSRDDRIAEAERLAAERREAQLKEDTKRLEEKREQERIAFEAMSEEEKEAFLKDRRLRRNLLSKTNVLLAAALGAAMPSVVELENSHLVKNKD